jgi:hypothetical protein
MPIGIGGVAFEGPYTRHEILGRRPGVFAVLDGRDLPPLHAEKADDVRRAVEEHARRNRWQEECETPAFAVFYTAVDRNQRRVEKAVRDEFGLYEDEEASAATNGRPDVEAGENGRRPARANGRPAAARDEPAASTDEKGEETEAPGERNERSFHFHVPADPVERRRMRAS